MTLMLYLVEEDGYTVKFQLCLSRTDRWANKGGEQEFGKPAMKLDQRKFTDVGSCTCPGGVRLQRLTELQHEIKSFSDLVWHASSWSA